MPHHHANRARVIPREFARNFLEVIEMESSDSDDDIDINVDELKIMSIKDRVNSFVEKSMQFVEMDTNTSLLKKREGSELGGPGKRQKLSDNILTSKQE